MYWKVLSAAWSVGHLDNEGVITGMAKPLVSPWNNNGIDWRKMQGFKDAQSV